MKIFRLFISMLVFCSTLNSAFAQERISSVGADVYEGIIRIKFDTQTVDDFTSIQMKSTSPNAPTVFTTGIQRIDIVNSDPDVFTFKRVFPYSQKFEAKHRAYGLHQWYEVQFSTAVGVEAMMDNYSSLDGIEIIKPVFRKVGLGFGKEPIKLTAQDVRKLQEIKLKSLSTDDSYPFDDPMLVKQWHYENFGDVAGTEDSDIDLFGAWKSETGSDSVIVAIIDGGVDYVHEDLSNAMWINETEMEGNDGVDDDENGYVDDIYGYNFYEDQGPISPVLHGTHVAGTVGAVNNNGIGVCGVAGGGNIDGGTSPGVRLMSCQIFSEASGSKGAEQAYVYAADNGAVIAQSSWSYTSAGYFEQEVRDAIDYFYDNAGDFDDSKVKGGVLLFSAGNNSTEGDFYPSAYEKVIGITSTGAYNTPASYTNYGETFDIAAPGGDYLADGSDAGGVLSTAPDNSYAYLSGTSMSTPHVSGVAALIVSRSKDKTLTNKDVYAKLLDYAVPFSSSNVYGDYEGKMGVGHLNALNCLLENEGVVPEAVGDFRLTDITHDKVVMEWQVPTDSDDIKPTSYQVYLGYEEFTSDDYSEAEVYSLTYDGEVGDTVTATLSGLESEIKLWFAVQAVDFWGNKSPLSQVESCTMLSAPLFYMKDHKFMFHVDVSKQLYGDTLIDLYNEGEGLLEWSSDIANYSFIFPSFIDSTRWFTDAEMADTTNIMTKSTLIDDNTITSQPVIPGTEVETDHLDRTMYTSGLYNDHADLGPEAVIGDFKTDHRVIQATRFQVPLDYNFTLTHVEAWLYYTVAKAPLKMEVRTGKELQTSELVYQRYYTPDTLGLQLANIPLERPVIMQDGIYFWLLLSHPEKETMPIVTNYMSLRYGTSFMSTDGGYSWRDFADVCGMSPQQMKIRAYSVGDDPSYTYIDPYSGEIRGNDSAQAHLYVNAENLRNGEHRSYINLYTNDYNYINTSIDMNIWVTGQKGELIYERDQDITNVVIGKTNEISIAIANDGLGDLEIQGVEFPSSEWSVVVDSAYSLLPTQSHDLLLNYTPIGTGYKAQELTIKTDAGHYPLFLNMGVAKPSNMAVIYDDTLELTLARGSTGSVTFTLKNTTDSDVPLDFDIYSETYPDGEHAKSRIYTYDYEHFNDASRWDPLNEFAVEMDYFQLTSIPLSFRFAFYEEVMNEVSIGDEAWMYFSSIDAGLYDLPSDDVSKGVIIPIGDIFRGGGMLSPVAAYYHGYGDRFVIQADSLYIGKDGGKSSFQTAVFKDGSIEYRYKVIDSLDYKHAIIGMQDFQADSSCMVKGSEDSTYLISDNDVIRFTPAESAPFLGRVSNDIGRLMPGDSINITVDINPDSSQLITGSYLNKIRIGANTLEENYYVPVMLNVIGQFDSLTVDTNKVDFGKVNTLTLYTDTLWVTNHSDDPTQMISFSSDLENVSIREGMSDFGPRESKRLLIDFIPQEPGEINETLTLSTSEGNVEITLTASSSLIPTFELDAKNEYHFDLDQEALTDTFTLKNTSIYTPLKYQIFGGGFVAINKVGATTSISKTSNSGNGLSTKSSNIDADTEDEAAKLRKALTMYGLADSAYSWEVSNGENAVQYYLDNLITSDSAVTMNIPKNGFVPIALKFPFSFYGESYDSVWINENGYLTVIEPEVDADPLNGIIFEKEDGVRGAIVPFWGDWTTVESEIAGVFLLSEEDRLVVQWRNVYTLDTYSSGEVSFEVILFNDGRIKFVYERINDYLGMFDYGLESPSEDHNIDLGREGWEINGFGVYADSTAITLAPGCFGELPPLGSIDLVMSASPSYMVGGDYNQNIILKTDALNPSGDTIIVSASVAEQKLCIATDTIDFGTHFNMPNTPISSSFWVNNRGRIASYIKSAREYDMPDFKLQNEDGYTIARNQRGDRELKEQHLLLPGEMIFYNVTYIPDTTQLNALDTVLYGKLVVKMTNNTFDIVTKVKFTARPSLYSEALDTSFVLKQYENEKFSFEIKNDGEDTLDFAVKGTFVGDNIIYDDPIAAPGAEFDKITYSFADVPDGHYANLSGVSFLISMHCKPEKDFNLTHVRAFTKLKYETDYTIRIEIFEYPFDTLYDRLSAPDTLGTLISSTEYRYQDDLEEKWRYMALEEPLLMEADKNYITVIIFPYSQGETDVLGTRLCYDSEMLNHFHYSSGASYSDMYGFNSRYMVSSWVPMLELIAGASTEGFMTFSPESGRLADGESMQIDVMVDPSVASSGDNYGTVNIDATNIVDHYDFDVLVNINAKPMYIMRPTNDTLVIQEKVPYVGSYLVEDPEGDKVTCSILDDDGLDIVLTAKEEAYAGLVQVSFNTGWEDQGIYDVIIEARDVNDNVNLDTLIVEVYNINRTPIMTFDDAIVINIAHDEVFQKNMNEMFIDPDKDGLTFQMGNGNPELYDMALLNDELLIAPIETGVGLVIFAADDGYDDGYAGYYYYVYVIDDKNVVPSQDGILPTVPTDEVAIENLFTAPNPTSGNSGVYFNLEEEALVNIQLYDMQGRLVKQVANHTMDAGNRYVETSLADLSSGIYFYKVVIGNGEVQMMRVVKE